MALRHRRTEEGQVYPALLLAVVGGFALAVAFVGLQNLLDQTGRAASASDAAALAVGQTHRDNVVGRLSADPAGSLGGFLRFLQGAGPAPGADQAAQEFARANGAQLDGGVTYQGFDAARHEWVYRVTTRQRDRVTGSGGASARSQSASKVAVTITGGLCPGLRGIEVGARCVDAATYQRECVAPPPPPPPPSPPATPSPGPDPHPGPTATAPPFHAQDYCGPGLARLLRWKIHLVD